MKKTEKQIWVICEIIDDALTVGSRQMLSKAKRLAKKINANVSIVLPVFNIKRELFGCIAGTHIYYCPNLQLISSLECSNILSQIINRETSVCVMFPDDSFWKEIAVRLACQIHAGLIADCIDIFVNTDMQSLVYTRLTHSGSKRADIVTRENKIGICTVKNHVFSENIESDLFRAPLSETYINTDSVRFSTVQVLDKKPIINKEAIFSLDNRKVILGIGQGVDIESMQKVNRIATDIGAGIGFSKPVIDLQNLARQNQIGQSGKFIVCDIYIAFGISGSIHHLCAIQKCKKVIAVNLDLNAPIIRFADVCIIADANAVIDDLYNSLCCDKRL